MHRFKRPNAATIIAFVALFAVLGGSAYAAKKITSKDIANGTIKLADLSGSARNALKGQRGPAGPAGPQGPAGPNVVAKLTPTTLDFSVPGGSGLDSIQTITVACPAGHRVVSGGYFMDNGFAYADKTYDGASWSVGVDNFGNTLSADGQLTALCAPAGVAVAASASAKSARAARNRDEAKREAAVAEK